MITEYDGVANAVRAAALDERSRERFIQDFVIQVVAGRGMIAEHGKSWIEHADAMWDEIQKGKINR